MLLQTNFYTIQSFVADEGAVQATLNINPQHRIFEGHFPNQPVVPGVCMLQMIKECAEKALGKRLLLKSASQIKYLKVLNPQENTAILLQIIWKENLGFSAMLQEDNTVIMKLSGAFGE